MKRKQLKKMAIHQVGRIAYKKTVGENAEMSEWRLRQICAELAAFGTLTADWWYNLHREQKRAVIAISCIVLTVALIFGIFRVVFDYNYNNISDDPTDLGFENVINEKIINVGDGLCALPLVTAQSAGGRRDPPLRLSTKEWL